MGHDPCTLAFSFPPYPKGGMSLRGHPKPWSVGRALYALKPWIGIDIWHVDPERRVEGQRRDDSCGWFDRRPHEYAAAVRDILADAGEVQALRNAFDRATHQPAGYSTGWKRMTPADCLAACLMVAMRLEHHGRFDLLCEALSTIERHADGAGGRLVVLGDFVDRGPGSRSIIDLLMAGPSLASWEWTVLQGNHEAMMLEVLAAGETGLLRWWISNGGGTTLRSYGYAQGDTLQPLKVPAEHIRWLSGLPVVLEDQHRIYVHAGVPFNAALGEVARDTLQWMLYSDAEDGAAAEAGRGHVSGKHIVHGHHQNATNPLLLPHRSNFDSFAWNTGRLAIGVFDDERAGGPIEVLWASGAPA